MTNLRGARVLVVGGSSGIGLAAAKAALDAGAVVTIASRSAEKLEKARSALGGAVSVEVMDVTNDLSVAAAMDRVGELDHVIYSAGEVGSGKVRKQPVEQAMASMNSKFWGAYRVAAKAQLKDSGSLTLVSGAYAIRPAAGRVMAAVVNASLETLAKGLALELAPLRVNAVSPGLVDTPLWDGVPEEARAEIYAAAARSNPARRVGQADDIAHAILSIATNPYITGTVLLVDGGGVLV